MIARFFQLLPFHFTVPEGEQFPVYHYMDQGYAVYVFPPGRSDRPNVLEGADEIKIDGKLAFQADVLRIDFHKDSFNRLKGTPCDPPEDILQRAINSFLVRLRHVTHSAKVRPLDYPWDSWRIRYLNDDETELELDEALVRGRGTLHFSFSWTALNKSIWEDIHKLPANYEPLPWEELLLDAQADLPRVGPAVVLAATALEVFISYILDRLASLGTVPSKLWDWINKRGDYLREPTVEEQYDVLLMFFTGHSLKSEPKLWESFRNLKTARNSFVHEGTAKIGGTRVSIETARRLVMTASDITLKIREWLPPELHWRVFKNVVQVEWSKKLT